MIASLTSHTTDNPEDSFADGMDERKEKKQLLKVLVCCHMPSEYIISTPPYEPIQAGKALHPDVDLGFQTDDTGDNISDRNARWCEWTVLYWGWKNIHDVKYMGLCHYRRYFGCDLSDSSVESLLKDRDIIVTPIVCLQCSVARWLGEWTSVECVHIFLSELLRLHPEYKDAIDSYCNGNKFYKCAMFIARKEVYDDFCATMVPVLEAVDRLYSPMQFTRQKRAIGYLGEVSLGLYITHKHLRCRVVRDRIFVPSTRNDSRLKKFMMRRRATAFIYLKLVEMKDRRFDVLYRIGWRLLTFADKRPLFNDTVVRGLKSDGYDCYSDTE